MTDVFQVLKMDHNEVKSMLTRLETGPSAATGAVGEQLSERKNLVDQLITEEIRHESAEQQYFWPAVRELGPEGDRLADEAIEQETDGESTLNALDKLRPDDERFEATLASFVSDARAHIAYEEAHVWPLLETRLSAQRSQELGDQIIAAKKMAPTRPHPSVPPQPGPQKTAGPVAAAADKLRDTISGRGRRS
ncbi:MAG TPA: hemerythrin domain-containing protein [Trebonia sp.]|jgi:hemerythrin-like domain-containing protein